MPKIDVFTAQGRTGNIEAQASPDSFGGQMGEGLQRFGQALESVSDKLQHQKDDIDLADRAAYFEQQAAEHYQKILTDDTLQGATVQDTMRLRSNAFKKFAREHMDGQGTTQIRDTLDENGAEIQKEIPPASGAVQIAMQKYIAHHLGQATVNLQADVLKREANRQANDMEQLSQKYADIAVREPWNETKNLGVMQQTFARAREAGVISREVIDKQEAAAFDRFYTQMASVSPERMLRIQADILSGGEPPRMMDQSKVMQYGNLAIARINAKDRANQADIKDLQDKNHANFVAQAIRGGMDRGTLADVVERRGIDPDKATALVNLNDKIKEKQREEHFIDGRTPQIETRLHAMKFDPKTTPAKVEAYRQTIFDARMKDQISQRDFEHLMSTWQGVNEHIHQEDKTGKNIAVTNARSWMETTLQVTGVMGFDSLSSQAKSAAILDYYRQLEQDPKANPLDIAEKVSKRYKPIIEERIKLSDEDQRRLNTAIMDGMANRGAISKAALQEWKEADQQKIGKSIVDRAIADYVPPSEPTWFDTIMEKVDKALGTEPKKDAAPKPDARLKMRK